MNNILREAQEKLKKQDQQINEFNKAESLESEGKINEVIKILEKIMYENGLIVNGVKWPFILADIYYKNKMYDKCWKYLNFIHSENIGEFHKIRDYQVKISKEENRPLDALDLKISSLLWKYTSVKFKPSFEKVEETLLPFIKKANLLEKKTEIINLYKKYINNEIFDEVACRKDFKELIK
jgi:hypothetical protein